MPEHALIRLTRTPDAVPISDDVYGHFLEQAFFGNVEGGVFDEGSPLAVGGGGLLAGCRADVIEACRELGLPVVRWPGGNYTSAAWWQDGTGPRDDRPRRLELAWGSEESNRFGTPEFLAWCEAVGTVPYLAHSARSVDDAVRWVEYVSWAGDTEMTRRRAADGHPEPYSVPWWGVGNEVYGDWQMGHRPVEQYVADALEHVRFMRAVDPSARFVAVGHEDREWTRRVVEGLGEDVDLVSLHLYGASRHLTGSTRAEFGAVVAQPQFFEDAIRDQAETIRQAQQGRDRPLGIAMDEWNIRHLEPAGWPEPQPGEDGGVAPRATSGAGGEGWRVNRYSPRTLADALFYAGVFHAVHRASQLPVPVAMANTVNLVNANGLLAVRPGGLVRAATYWVWDLYQNRTGRYPLAASVAGPSWTTDLRMGDDRRGDGFRTRPVTVGALDVSATTDEDGRVLHLAVVNRSADEDITSRLQLEGGGLPATAVAHVLGAGGTDLFAANSFERPDAVRTAAPAEVSLRDGEHTFPAHSVTVLDVEVRAGLRG
ncbi:alpha-L-arabinofuranosidase C-terminal domain-containing protein [Pseudokineococcus sp. 5B2Z-1]|uniref:alpha-L-arabinofuranosidase C-terminal domain-containing protein n=1 Tax=Pseudokineococcus sp. 5B2Z-1 TaxID=3132744 RepID=UPI0030B74DD5